MCTTGLFLAHSPAAPPEGPSAWGTGKSCRDTGPPGEVRLRLTMLLQDTQLVLPGGLSLCCQTAKIVVPQFIAQ